MVDDMRLKMNMLIEHVSESNTEEFYLNNEELEGHLDKRYIDGMKGTLLWIMSSRKLKFPLGKCLRSPPTVGLRSEV